MTKTPAEPQALDDNPVLARLKIHGHCLGKPYQCEYDVALSEAATALRAATRESAGAGLDGRATAPGDEALRTALRRVSATLHANMHSRVVSFDDCDFPECVLNRAALSPAAPEPREGLDCDIDVWDGPYKMKCGRQIVNGECGRHGNVPAAPTPEPADRLEGEP